MEKIEKIIESEMRQNSFFKIIIFTFFVGFISCNQKDVFFQYKKVNIESWKINQPVKISCGLDTNQNYNFYIHIRNNNEYGYQNLWLFVAQKQHDKIVRTDTVELFLADKFGKWLGSGVGALRENSVLYRKNVQGMDSCDVFITQGMRTDELKGIQEVGLRIEKAE